MAEVDRSPEEAPDEGERLLSDNAMWLYRRLGAGESVSPDDAEALQELVDLALVSKDPWTEGQYNLTDPAVAEFRAIEKERLAIRSHLERMEQLHSTIAALPQPAAQAGGGARLLMTMEEANRAIADASAKTRTFICSAHPKDRTQSTLQASLPRDLELAARNKYRTIYPDSARLREPESIWVTAMTAAGAEVRTKAPDFPRMIIVDHSAVFLNNPVPENGAVAVMITHPVIVATFVEHFNWQWDRATPWRGERRHAVEATITTAQSRRIIRLYRAGKTRRQISRELGLSERWITETMKEIYRKLGFDKLGLDNLLALGEWWATTPERHLD